MNEDFSSHYKGSLLERLVTLGTGGWYGQDKLGLIIANVTGYLATLSSLGFALTYAMHEYHALVPLVWGNVVSAGCTAITPAFHRFGRIAAALWLTAVVLVSVTWFSSLLGREFWGNPQSDCHCGRSVCHTRPGAHQAGGSNLCGSGWVDHPELDMVARAGTRHS